MVRTVAPAASPFAVGHGQSGRLRRLADVHPDRGRVLSVYLNLDPSELPTPAARSSAVTSILTEAAHRVEEAGELAGDERRALRTDLERVR